MSLSFETMSAIRYGYGYGFGPARYTAKSSDDLLGELDAGVKQRLVFIPDGVPAWTAMVADLRQRGLELDKVRKTMAREKFVVESKAIQKEMYSRGREAVRDRIAQAVLSPYGFYERLSYFWINHFSVSLEKRPIMSVIVPLYEAQAIRPHIGGRFGHLLKSAIMHPAMVIYLDQHQSIGPNSKAGRKKAIGLNENLGRELLELHTMGAGSGYTQQDVRSASLILTGLGITKDFSKPAFRPENAEPGQQTVMGQSYGHTKRTPTDIETMLEELAVRPETANYICRKLVSHFIADDPPQVIVDGMVSAWKSTDGDLRAVYAALLEHPVSWTAEGRKAKLPFDFIISTMRALRFDEQRLSEKLGRSVEAGSESVAMMGTTPAVSTEASGNKPDMQNFMTGAEDMRPDKGKTKDEASIPYSEVARQSAGRLGQAFWAPPSPAGWDEDFGTWISPGQLTERIQLVRELTTQIGNNQDPKEFLKETLAEAAHDNTIKVVSRAPSKQVGVMLTLLSPEFNRR